MRVLSFLIAELLVRRIIDVAIEGRICEDILDYFVRVPIPNVIFCGLPLWKVGCLREIVVELEGCILPANVTEFNGINLPVEISLAGNGWGGIVGNKSCSPQFEESGDFSP